MYVCVVCVQCTLWHGMTVCGIITPVIGSERAFYAPVLIRRWGEWVLGMGDGCGNCRRTCFLIALLLEKRVTPVTVRCGEFWIALDITLSLDVVKHSLCRHCTVLRTLHVLAHEWTRTSHCHCWCKKSSHYCSKINGTFTYVP